MAAVVAATALKGRGARNARVLRGKERDPGEGRTEGDPFFFFTICPAVAGVMAVDSCPNPSAGS